ADYGKVLELDPQNASIHNNLAWLLATDTDLKVRDPKRAVELAKKAVELAPKEGYIRNTLGVAYYRAGEWKAAIVELEKSMELRAPGRPSAGRRRPGAWWRGTLDNVRQRQTGLET